MNREIKVDWMPYCGNNKHQIDPPEIIFGGAASFGKHIGKPLSRELWEDLFHRLQINGLCVYRPSDIQWCLEWGPGHCTVYLDLFGNVRDIEFTPYVPPRKGQSEDIDSKKEFAIREELGELSLNANKPPEIPETEEGMRQETLRLDDDLFKTFRSSKNEPDSEWSYLCD